MSKNKFFAAIFAGRISPLSSNIYILRMNFTKFCAFSALSFALFGLCSCERSDIHLVYNTQTVSPQAFVLESTLNASFPGDSNTAPESMRTNVSVRSTMSLLMSYDDGSGRFEMNIDSVKYSSDKRSVDEFRNIEKYLSIQNFQFKLDRDGSVSNPTIENALDMPSEDELNLIPLFLKAQPLLPEKPVKVGESWERQMPIPGKGYSSTTVYKTFTLQDVYLQDGIRMAKIHMGMKYLELPDTTSNFQLKSSDYVIGDGYVLFDVTHGTLSSAEMNIVAVLDVCDLVARDTLPSMNVNQKITLRNLQ